MRLVHRCARNADCYDSMRRNNQQKANLVTQCTCRTYIWNLDLHSSCVVHRYHEVSDAAERSYRRCVRKPVHGYARTSFTGPQRPCSLAASRLRRRPGRAACRSPRRAVGRWARWFIEFHAGWRGKPASHVHPSGHSWAPPPPPPPPPPLLVWAL